MSQFHEGLAEIFEVEPAKITRNFDLNEDNWDSLAIVSTIALIDEVYDITVSGEALAECKSVADIEALIGKTAGA